MINPKKKLKEIIKKMLEMPEFIAPDRYNINQTTTEILKEFVHKDNLPSVEEIGNFILKELRKTDEYVGGDNINYTVCLDGEFDLKLIAKAIRRLIEGNK